MEASDPIKNVCKKSLQMGAVQIWGWSPKKSVLHKTISPIRMQTFEEINRVLPGSARQEKLESGKVVRMDSTVTAAPIHAPSDSSLLWDASTTATSSI